MSVKQEDRVVDSPGATIDGVVHHRAHVNGTELHYVSAEDNNGSPVLLVHGFPESWWTFHKLIPLLSDQHRVFAVDLRGFGDSAPADAEHTSAIAAADLEALISALNVGPVHLTGQDIGGPTTFRVAASQPELVRSYTAIETGLPGFGLEMLADVTSSSASRTPRRLQRRSRPVPLAAERGRRDPRAGGRKARHSRSRGRRLLG